MGTLTVWRFDTAEGADEASSGSLHWFGSL